MGCIGAKEIPEVGESTWGTEGTEQATFPARRRSMSHIGALARGSVVGISGSFSAAVAAHVTRPTGLGHGRLAHALAWRGVAPAPIGAGRPRWAPPIDAPPPASPSPDWMDDVSAEARFAEAVRRQFAFSEARLLAWSSPLSPPLSPTHTSESPALPPQSPPLPQLSSHSASQSLCQSPALASSPSLGSAHTNSLSPDAPPPLLHSHQHRVPNYQPSTSSHSLHSSYILSSLISALSQFSSLLFLFLTFYPSPRSSFLSMSCLKSKPNVLGPWAESSR